MDEESINDSDIPSGAIVSAELGRPVTDLPEGNTMCVSQWEKDNDSGGWVANADHEEIWAWNDKGEQWGDKLPMRSDN